MIAILSGLFHAVSVAPAVRQRATVRRQLKNLICDFNLRLRTDTGMLHRRRSNRVRNLICDFTRFVLRFFGRPRPAVLRCDIGLQVKFKSDGHIDSSAPAARLLFAREVPGAAGLCSSPGSSPTKLMSANDDVSAYRRRGAAQERRGARQR